MSQLPILVPASRLVVDPKNVRKKRSAAFQAEMKASVAAKGILQNLIGRPIPRKKGWYYVSAGGSRLEAVNANIADGAFEADYGVPLLVRDGKDASETSLTENIIRAGLTPTEECRAYQDVVQIERVTPADLAKRIHRSEQYVLGRLRLADLTERVFDALEAGEISLQIAEAYGSTPDTERQAAVYELLHEGPNRNNPSEIRRKIESYSYPASDPRCRLVGRDAYLAAGGKPYSDLFTNAENERWLDTHIVDRLAGEILAKTAEELRARDGYAEVRTVTGPIVPYMETYSLDTIEGEREPLSPEQEERLDAIATEIEAIEVALEDPDHEPGDDEARAAALQAEYDAIEARPAVLGEAQRANALAYLVIGADGRPRLHDEVFAVPAPQKVGDEDEEEDGRDGHGDRQETGTPGDKVDTEDAIAGQPVMSQVQADRLATMKTELLAVHVASDPGFALDLATFVMAERATRTFDHADIPSELRGEAAPVRVREFESGTAAAAEWTKLDDALDRSWSEPATIEERYDAFCGLSDEARAAWLGWAVARTLHAVPAGGAGAGLLDRLGRKLDIDVAAWWRPTARNFFDRQPVRSILALFEEIGGAELRARYGASKKHDLAASAERLFAGDTIVEADIKARAIAWVPDVMRFAPPPIDQASGSDETRDQVAGDPAAPANDADESVRDAAA